jgi:CheY-like chemotaxis protein
VGRGTTFKIYLPRVAPDVDDGVAAAPRLRQGAETILVAEDEADVRDLVQDILRSYGYTVLLARDPAEALLIAERHTGPIHLLLTDVIMPGATGRDLAARLAPLRPEARTLYMFGYPGEAIVRAGHRREARSTARTARARRRSRPRRRSRYGRRRSVRSARGPRRGRSRRSRDAPAARPPRGVAAPCQRPALSSATRRSTWATMRSRAAA